MASESPPSLAHNVPVSAGDVVAEKYAIEGVIGAGGVGVVVSATHLTLGHKVAIKLLQRAALASDENLPRFEREMRILARIKSEHVARVIDCGQLPSGEPFMVLEHLEGQDLSAVMRERHRLPVGEAVDLVLQACAGVAAAHAVGVVHRDLKPANLFCTRMSDEPASAAESQTDVLAATSQREPGAAGACVVKVLDFGISKLVHAEGADRQAVTQTLSVIGSPLYMSPEQMESPRDADARADVWSLGVILYELIAGKAPFDAPTLPLLCARICTEAPTPLTVHGLEVEPALDAVLLCCLEKDREKRYPNMAALAAALLPFAGASGVLAARRCGALPSAEPDAVGSSRDRLSDPGNATAETETDVVEPIPPSRRWSWSTIPPPNASGAPAPRPRRTLGLSLIGAFVLAIFFHQALGARVHTPARGGQHALVVQARHVAEIAALLTRASMAEASPPVAAHQVADPDLVAEPASETPPPEMKPAVARPRSGVPTVGRPATGAATNRSTPSAPTDVLRER